MVVFSHIAARPIFSNAIGMVPKITRTLIIECIKDRFCDSLPYFHFWLHQPPVPHPSTPILHYSLSLSECQSQVVRGASSQLYSQTCRYYTAPNGQGDGSEGEGEGWSRPVSTLWHIKTIWKLPIRHLPALATSLTITVSTQSSKRRSIELISLILIYEELYVRNSRVKAKISSRQLRLPKKESVSLHLPEKQGRKQNPAPFPDVTSRRAAAFNREAKFRQ